MGSLYDKSERLVKLVTALCNELKWDKDYSIIMQRQQNFCKSRFKIRLCPKFPDEMQGNYGWSSY